VHILDHLPWGQGTFRGHNIRVAHLIDVYQIMLPRSFFDF
jgi:hypothetical protein